MKLSVANMRKTHSKNILPPHFPLSIRQ